MKTGIHPQYITTTVNCACGHSFQTQSVKETIKVDVCSHCHPFYTGKGKAVDTEGQVSKFMKKMETAKKFQEVQEKKASKD